MSANSTRALAEALGVSKSTIHRDMSSMSGDVAPGRVIGLDGKSYPAKRGYSLPAEWLVERRNEGASYRELAAEAGVSHQTVMRLFHRLESVQVSQPGHVDQRGVTS